MKKWDPTGHPAYLLGRAARLFERRTHERLKELGLSSAHIPVLRALKDGEALSQTALAALAHIEQPTMAQMLARMERDRLVQRVPNPADGRSSLYSLTRATLAKVQNAQRAVERGAAELLAPLTAAETAALAAILTKVVAHLEGGA
ncbi:MAG: MarR family transcriptional regulator [Deltaproteobacteria bacterium]|nr:MarR family transcriptional regulator [Deltaproteobacteria bacterium]MCW5801390.1 MarR family transcriptional regulator [Deltaproteobacteria bacterium]